MTDGLDRAALRVGSVLDEKWTLERLLGVGGMGAVYEARHRNGARAAVKVLHPALASIDEVRERFLREGYAANKVDHRGAVQVLDDDVVKDGLDAGAAYLVMELLEGESLQDRARRAPPLTEVELLEVMEAVLDVLAAAHARGVVHRDLKPENVFLATDAEREGVRVKVLDFGLARIAEAASVTSAGMAVGTPSFMSPEQASGRNDEIDGRTDVFALGATMFRIVTGRRVHEAENMVELVSLMASEPAPPLRTVKPDAAEALAGVVDRALFFERDDRPTAEGLSVVVRQALSVLRETEEPHAGRMRILPASARNLRVADAAPSAPAVEPVFLMEAPRRGTTLPWVLVLALLVVVGWLALPHLGSALDRHATVAPPPTAPPPSALPPIVELPSTPPAPATDELPPEPEELGGSGLPPPPLPSGIGVAAHAPSPSASSSAASAALPGRHPVPPWVKKRQQKPR